MNSPNIPIAPAGPRLHQPERGAYEEATISDIKAVKIAAQRCGGLKKLSAQIVVLGELIGAVGSLHRITQVIEYLKEAK